jgi:hypothetical protein
MDGLPLPEGPRSCVLLRGAGVHVAPQAGGFIPPWRDGNDQHAAQILKPQSFALRQPALVGTRPDPQSSFKELLGALLDGGFVPGLDGLKLLVDWQE